MTNHTQASSAQDLAQDPSKNTIQDAAQNTAHSLAGPNALNELALQVGLSLEEGQAVTDHWLLLAAIAQPLMEFPLPQSLDPAPRFAP